ncbi:MAG TPA: iron ABC transporter permease [Thermoleophilia bacterium]|nr:iron ABC transporter permease [Thermoleophilia bacterium]
MIRRQAEAGTKATGRGGGVEVTITSTAVVVLSLLILLPLGVLLAASLGGKSLTLHYFSQIFLRHQIRSVTLNTILVALGSTSLAIFIGVPLAWLVHRTRVLFSSLWDSLIILPFFVSPVIIALSWLAIAGKRGLLYVVATRGVGVQTGVNVESLAGIIGVMGLYYTAYMYLYTSIGLRNMDPALEEASYTSGASTLRTAWRVTLPLATPAILAGALLVFTSSVSHFSIPLILGRPNGINVLTTRIYEMLIHYPPEFNLAAAISMVLLLITATGVAAQRLITRNRSFITIGGKARGEETRRAGWVSKVAFLICALYSLVFVIVPFVMLTVVSLMRYYTFDGPTFSLDNYAQALLRHPITLRGIRNSVLLATLGASATVLLGSIVAYVVVRGRSRGKVVVDFLSAAPVVIPATALAVALLATWIRVPFLYGSLGILLIAYCTLYIPYGTRAANANLMQIDADLEAASRTSGASWAYTFRRIVVPLMRPGMSVAWIVLFVGMIKEISASILLYGFGTETMSVVLYELWYEGSFTLAASLAIIQGALIAAVLATFVFATGTRLRSLT